MIKISKQMAEEKKRHQETMLELRRKEKFNYRKFKCVKVCECCEFFNYEYECCRKYSQQTSFEVMTCDSWEKAKDFSLKVDPLEPPNFREADEDGCFNCIHDRKGKCEIIGFEPEFGPYICDKYARKPIPRPGYK